jgi:hypothetical protein
MGLVRTHTVIDGDVYDFHSTAILKLSSRGIQWTGSSLTEREDT